MQTNSKVWSQRQFKVIGAKQITWGLVLLYKFMPSGVSEFLWTAVRVFTKKPSEQHDTDARRSKNQNHDTHA